MREQAHIEKDGADGGCEPVEQWRIAGRVDREHVGGQGPGHQGEDEDQAPVEADLDAEQSTEPDARIHRAVESTVTQCPACTPTVQQSCSTSTAPSSTASISTCSHGRKRSSPKGFRSRSGASTVASA